MFFVTTITCETTFDPAKSEANWRKHGVSLRLAASIHWPGDRCAPDSRRDYGELREVGYAPIDGYLYCVVFTQRRSTFRVISLRRANSREVKRYVEQTETTETAHPHA
jgi:uncharacterized DUF497 family protein